MVAVASTPDPYNEGYPRSTEDDLDPGPDVSESLADADRVATDEHRVVPGGREADGLTDEADSLEDTDDPGSVP